MYRVSDFNYHLPLELIAQTPLKPRDHSRLLLLDRHSGKIEHQHFYDLSGYFRSGDVLVLNDSKVFPARLIGRKEGSGGRVEVFLHRHLAGKIWECLVGGRAREGIAIILGGGLKATIVKNNEDGTWQLEFNMSGGHFWRVIHKIGIMPLPPYIKRAKQRAADKKDYQTVYADPRKAGSVAAPTAGRHFTKKLLKDLTSRGVQIVYVTLHVGLGTFAPVKAVKIKDHKMHSEFASVSAAALRKIHRAKEEGRRVIAVGTTSARTLESLDLGQTGRQSFWTDIFIYPGYTFKLVDALITNFHLPRSTLIMLVSALAGKGKIDKAYRAAIRHKYRFFSYGDAMFIY